MAEREKKGSVKFLELGIEIIEIIGHVDLNFLMLGFLQHSPTAGAEKRYKYRAKYHNISSSVVPRKNKEKSY